MDAATLPQTDVDSPRIVGAGLTVPRGLPLSVRKAAP
jgi:hypothetical protein